MTTPQLSVAADRHRARVLVAGGAVGLLLAVVLTFADAPTSVRTALCLPLLVAISGAAFSAVLVPEQSRLDGVSRTGLVVLLGLGALLVSALLVGLLLRDGLPATRVVLVLAALTAVPLVLLGRGASVGPLSRSGLPNATLSPGSMSSGSMSSGSLWSGVAGVALLVGALALGTALIPRGSAAPTFSFTGPAATAPGPTPVAPNTQVPLSWSLRHAGTLPAGTVLQAVIDGRAVGVSGDLVPDGAGEYRGTATVQAPAEPGVHRVVLSAPLPSQRLELVTYVDVQSGR
jgi:hypothetical protein